MTTCGGPVRRARDHAEAVQVVRAIGVLEPGGAQLSALRLSRALREHGIETRLLAGDATAAGLDPPRERLRGPALRRGPRPAVGAVRRVRRVAARALRRRRP